MVFLAAAPILVVWAPVVELLAVRCFLALVVAVEELVVLPAVVGFPVVVVELVGPLVVAGFLVVAIVELLVVRFEILGLLDVMARIAAVLAYVVIPAVVEPRPFGQRVVHRMGFPLQRVVEQHQEFLGRCCFTHCL